MTVMTFNTANDFVRSDTLIAILAESSASIVGLQELSPENARALANSLRAQFPYRILHGAHVDGKGLLSCYPIREHERFPLASGRSYIEAELVVEDRIVSVFVAHPPPPNYRRLEVASPHATPDITMLLDRVSPTTPTLLIGDFNFVRPSRNYRLVRRTGLIDTFREVGQGRGLTYPTRAQPAAIPLPPLLRIDYIWATSHFVPLASWVGSGGGSDHLPVVSVLALLPA